MEKEVECLTRIAFITWRLQFVCFVVVGCAFVVFAAFLVPGPPRFRSGRNSQSIGGMTGAESSHDSDKESFVSRVGSFALTDIGAERGGPSGKALGAGGGGGAGAYSPTSTVLRSNTVSSSLRRICVLFLLGQVLFCPV